MNRTIVVVLEIMVAVFAFALIVIYVQGTLNNKPSCEGIPPIDSNGLIKGPSTYNNPMQNNEWAYDPTATTKTPCRWRCDYNYIRRGNECVLK